MRALVWLTIAFALSACGHRDGRDGMDGFGVAAGLRHELQRNDR